jgi:hypothetical protein
VPGEKLVPVSFLSTTNTTGPDPGSNSGHTKPCLAMVQLACVSCDNVGLGKYNFAEVPVAARSKTSVCGHSLAGIAGSNPAVSMDVCRECCVLSGRGLCIGLITRPEKSCRVWCV